MRRLDQGLVSEAKAAERVLVRTVLFGDECVHHPARCVAPGFFCAGPSPSSERPSWPALLDSVIEGHHLSDEQSTALMRAWLAEELAGSDRWLPHRRVPKDWCPRNWRRWLFCVACRTCERPDLLMVDTCGTGGDGADTFNISTAVAFAAACGVGGGSSRSASGKVGSADVLESLGLQLKAPLAAVVRALATGVTFLFAPAWHPARESGLARQPWCSHGVLLGPLVNPSVPRPRCWGWLVSNFCCRWRGCGILGSNDRSLFVVLADWMRRPCRSQSNADD